MSTRYSADAVVRLKYDRDKRGGYYEGTVSDPGLWFKGWVSSTRRFARDPTCPEAYDDAARRLAQLAQRWARENDREFMVEEENGRVRIRRGFQSACPLEDL